MQLNFLDSYNLHCLRKKEGRDDVLVHFVIALHDVCLAINLEWFDLLLSVYLSHAIEVLMYLESPTMVTPRGRGLFFLPQPIVEPPSFSQLGRKQFPFVEPTIGSRPELPCPGILP